jgi:hypothetical protein
MKRTLIGVAVLCGALTVPTSSRAQTGCARPDLEAAVQRYLTAQGKGNTSGMLLATNVTYSENMQDAALGKSILQTPLTIDFHRSLLDADACETFTEVIVTDARHPYVLGVRLKLAAGRISEIENAGHRPGRLAVQRRQLSEVFEE